MYLALGRFLHSAFCQTSKTLSQSRAGVPPASPGDWSVTESSRASVPDGRRDAYPTSSSHIQATRHEPLAITLKACLDHSHRVHCAIKRRCFRTGCSQKASPGRTLERAAANSPPLALRSDEPHRRKEGADAAGITGEQRQMGHVGVRADEEIRQTNQGLLLECPR